MLVQIFFYFCGDKKPFESLSCSGIVIDHVSRSGVYWKDGTLNTKREEHHVFVDIRHVNASSERKKSEGVIVHVFKKRNMCMLEPKVAPRHIFID